MKCTKCNKTVKENEVVLCEMPKGQEEDSEPFCSKECLDEYYPLIYMW